MPQYEATVFLSSGAVRFFTCKFLQFDKQKILMIIVMMVSFFIVPVKYTVKDRQAGKDSFVNFGIFLYSVCGFLCMINLRKIKMSSIFI